MHGAINALSGTITLTASLHDLQLLYGQDPNDSYLKLEYSGPDTGTNRIVVPSAVLCSTGGQPLPVTLTRFEAQATGPAEARRWATASEQNSASFEVERSAAGLSFGKIGQVAAAGATAQVHQYQLLDRTPLASEGYYRLRQLDLDGTAHYSPVVAVQQGSGAPAPFLTLAPNPSSGPVVVPLMGRYPWPRMVDALPTPGAKTFTDCWP